VAALSHRRFRDHVGKSRTGVRTWYSLYLVRFAMGCLILAVVESSAAHNLSDRPNLAGHMLAPLLAAVKAVVSVSKALHLTVVDAK